MKKTLIGIFLVLILSIGTILPFFKVGFFDFHDNTQVVRVYQMGVMLLEGAFPVRWVPDLGYGYGYPIFNFYGPLPYYVGGLFNVIGLDALISTKAMIVIGILLSAVTMFFLIRKFYGDTAAIIGAVAYTYFPYHAVNIYVRGAIGELFAYAFLPLLFLGIFQLVDIKKIRASIFLPILLIAFSFFLIIISHNLTAFMTIPILSFVFIALFFQAQSRKTLLGVGIGALILGILLSFFYMLPAFLEMKYTNVSSQVGGGADYRDHFVCIGQFWNSAWGFGGSTLDCNDGMSFKLGKLNIILFVISIILFVYNITHRKFRIYEKILAAGFVLGILSLFLTQDISSFVWSSVPLMDYIQYPWRFINFLALSMSFAIGYILFFVKENYKARAPYIIGAVIILGIIITNGKLFVPQNVNQNDYKFYTDKAYINFTVSKISDEYMPKGFSKPQDASNLPENPMQTENAQGSINIQTEKPLNLEANLILEKEERLLINRAYYPSWQAYINGNKTEIYPANNGMIIAVPKGEVTVELKFQNTIPQLVGNLVTSISFLTILAAIIVVSIRKK